MKNMNKETTKENKFGITKAFIKFLENNTINDGDVIHFSITDTFDGGYLIQFNKADAFIFMKKEKFFSSGFMEASKFDKKTIKIMREKIERFENLIKITL